MLCLRLLKKYHKPTNIFDNKLVQNHIKIVLCSNMKSNS